MKACVLHAQAAIETDPLRLEEVPAPEPAAGQVLVRVHVCGICRTDLHVIEGDLAPRKLPLIPGHQIVGRVTALGSGVSRVAVGQRVGIAWLHETCGTCRFCASGRENLCDRPEFTGWTADGGFAQFVVAPAGFVYPLPESFPDLQAAPLLCAGIIGYRALMQTGLACRADGFSGTRLGIYGFGAAGHVVIQLARDFGAEVYVVTRDQSHRKLAQELGACWTGGIDQLPPRALDASMMFAPAGDLIPPALRALDRGGCLVLGGIYMSPTPEMEYGLLYDERRIISVANNTREDGERFLEHAARIPVQTHVEKFPLAEANLALRALKNKAIRGCGVIQILQRQ